ncbi:MAG: helix-turn-helix transcriptional regulator [Clostridia bacterium]|nr:helix-turn-helix transcriptional regulator [Clostridia bacterium]
MQDYGKRIKEARERAGVTQEELGKKIGVTGVTIMRYEKGLRQPNLQRMVEIANALEISVTDMLGLESADESAEAAQEVLAAFQGICSMIMTDDRIPDEVKSAVKGRLPPNPDLALNALAYHAGEAQGIVMGLMAGFEDEAFLINACLNALTPEGKAVALERVKELTEIGRYRRRDASPVIAALDNELKEKVK